MATQVGPGAAGLRFAPRRASDGDSTDDPAVLAATLVVMLEQALQTARRLLGELDPAAEHHVATACPTPGIPSGGLSHREAEVLRLLAAGHSNRRIAIALCLSPRTVQRHVANVYLKIGAHCRAEATVYALQHGLA